MILFLKTLTISKGPFVTTKTENRSGFIQRRPMILDCLLQISHIYHSDVVYGLLSTLLVRMVAKLTLSTASTWCKGIRLPSMVKKAATWSPQNHGISHQSSKVPCVLGTIWMATRVVQMSWDLPCRMGKGSMKMGEVYMRGKSQTVQSRFGPLPKTIFHLISRMAFLILTLGRRPTYSFHSTAVHPFNHFGRRSLIISLAFCGRWASSNYEKLTVPNSLNATCPTGTCKQNVRSNPSLIKEAYWLLNSIRVYENPVEASCTWSCCEFWRL